MLGTEVLVFKVLGSESVKHMQKAENACTLRFGRRHFADGLRIFQKGVNRVFHGQANDGCNIHNCCKMIDRRTEKGLNVDLSSSSTLSYSNSVYLWDILGIFFFVFFSTATF